MTNKAELHGCAQVGRVAIGFMYHSGTAIWLFREKGQTAIAARTADFTPLGIINADRDGFRVNAGAYPSITCAVEALLALRAAEQIVGVAPR